MHWERPVTSDLHLWICNQDYAWLRESDGGKMALQVAVNESEAQQGDLDSILKCKSSRFYESIQYPNRSEVFQMAS